MDETGNIYVTDTSNHTIRKVTPTGVVSILVGAPGPVIRNFLGALSAALTYSLGIAVNSTGVVFITLEHAVLEVKP